VSAEIIAIGTEILLGELTDTNSVFIAQQMRSIGVNIFFMTSVGDNEARITDAIRIALGRADIVITCGGLGPTVDDMTRQAVAAATGRGLTFHQALLDAIAARFSTFRAQMTENNRQQAYIPDEAVIIENPVGTAPCFIVEHGEQAVISLPGVPREMKYLLVERVMPYLQSRYALGETVIKARVLRTAGLGESLLDERLGKTLLQAANPTIGLNAHMGSVDVRITAKAANEAEADAMIATVEAQVRAKLAGYIFGSDKETLEAALIAALRRGGHTLAITTVGYAPFLEARLAGGEDVIAATAHYPTIAAGSEPGGDESDLRALAERLAHEFAQANGAAVGIAIVGRPVQGEGRAEADLNDHADADESSALAVWTAHAARSRGYGFGVESETAPTWLATWAMAAAWRLLAEMDESR
jgi:nicotinamide-nucleotide amidase